MFISYFAEANSRKKKVYEQQENEENPLRCPVKLYEFYISKWYVLNLLWFNNFLENVEISIQDKII